MLQPHYARPSHKNKSKLNCTKYIIRLNTQLLLLADRWYWYSCIRIRHSQVFLSPFQLLSFEHSHSCGHAIGDSKRNENSQFIENENCRIALQKPCEKKKCVDTMDNFRAKMFDCLFECLVRRL